METTGRSCNVRSKQIELVQEVRGGGKQPSLKCGMKSADMEMAAEVPWDKRQWVCSENRPIVLGARLPAVAGAGEDGC